MDQKKKSFSLLVILAISLALILPGCISTTYEIKLNLDGSGENKQDLAIDESVAGLMESSEQLSGEKSLEERLKESMPKDGKYKKFTKEGKIHHQITFNFKDVDELNKINQKLKKISNVSTPVKAKLERVDFLVFASYTFTNKFPAASKSDQSEEEEKMADATSITYKLTLPGKITKANTDEIEKDTVTWNINPTKGGKIEASSQYIRWWLVIVLIVVFLLVIGVTAIGFFIAYRKLKAPTSETSPTPQEGS